MIIDTKKIIVFVLILVVVVSFGWFIYSSKKSNNEVPKRATFVDNNTLVEYKGMC